MFRYYVLSKEQLSLCFFGFADPPPPNTRKKGENESGAWMFLFSFIFCMLFQYTCIEWGLEAAIVKQSFFATYLSRWFLDQAKNRVHGSCGRWWFSVRRSTCTGGAMGWGPGQNIERSTQRKQLENCTKDGNHQFISSPPPPPPPLPLLVFRCTFLFWALLKQRCGAVIWSHKYWITQLGIYCVG